MVVLHPSLRRLIDVLFFFHVLLAEDCKTIIFCLFYASYSPSSGSECSFFNIANTSLKLDAQSELEFGIFPWKNFLYANPVENQLKAKFYRKETSRSVVVLC